MITQKGKPEENLRFAYSLGLKPGDVVEVKSKAEILKTLEADGTLDRLPFMPEMRKYCGKRFRVYKRADKTCDTVNQTGGLRMTAAVHLENLRCDGSAHGGCQAACLLFWKEAWLTPVSSGKAERPMVSRLIENIVPQGRMYRDAVGRCTDEQVDAAVFQSEAERTSDDPAFSCQATVLPEATRFLPWWSPGQYFRELASGNITSGRALRAFVFVICRRIIKAGVGYQVLLRLYNAVQRLRGGVDWPYLAGTGDQPCSEKLDLEPGEWVEIKSYPEILATVDRNNRNRGLSFDPEMVPYCGKRFRVLSRVDKILNERTGKMLKMRNDCIILDGVFCRSDYSECRAFCPRAIYSYWREAWLRRVNPGDGPA